MLRRKIFLLLFALCSLAFAQPAASATMTLQDWQKKFTEALAFCNVPLTPEGNVPTPLPPGANVCITQYMGLAKTGMMGKVDCVTNLLSNLPPGTGENAPFALLALAMQYCPGSFPTNFTLPYTGGDPGHDDW